MTTRSPKTWGINSNRLYAWKQRFAPADAGGKWRLQFSRCGLSEIGFNIDDDIHAVSNTTGPGSNNR